jgi:hypothetical protein
MRKTLTAFALLVAVLLVAFPAEAFRGHGGVRVGIGIGIGIPLGVPYYGGYGYPVPYPYPVYQEPQVIYVPAPAPVMPAPTAQRQVCYETGCYHLLGDGVYSPYQWVWVPYAGAPSR